MPNLKLTNLASYRAYFADVAVKHKQIDAYKWGDESVINNDVRSDFPKRILWAQPYENYRYDGNQSDNINKNKTARVGYFVIPVSKSFADIEAAYIVCESVIEDIISKILMDKRGADVNGVWTLLATNINSFKVTLVEYTFGSTWCIGCELELEFSDNTNLVYDPNKWNS
jgi:hypothetical protein